MLGGYFFPLNKIIAVRCEKQIKHLTHCAHKMHSVIKLKYVVRAKGKGKAVPLQDQKGPEGSTKLRFPDFVTTVVWW